MTEASSVDLHGSQFVQFAHKLDASTLSALRIDESSLLSVAIIVKMCRILMDPSDSRPWIARLDEYFTELESDTSLARVAELSSEDSLNKLKTWIKDASKPFYKGFAKRLLGPAKYGEFEAALRADAAVVTLIIRRTVRGAMLFAVAWDDAVGLMSKDQLVLAAKVNVLGLNATSIIISLDSLLGEKLLPNLPMSLAQARDHDLTEWKLEDSVLLATQFRSLISEASASRIERENSSLVRKIRGARDALKYSEDGISQAANSLIELIDRLMREAYSQEEVLAWVDTHLPDTGGLTFLDENGQRRATKQAEALCLVYGGGSTSRPATEYDDGIGPSFIHDILARVVVVARSKLQRLKHADGGSAEEREQLLVIMAALEGALMLGLPLGRLSAQTNLAEQTSD